MYQIFVSCACFNRLISSDLQIYPMNVIAVFFFFFPLHSQSQQNSTGLAAKGPSDQNSFSNIPHEGKQHTPLYERASPDHAEAAFFNASSASSSSENEEITGPTAKWVLNCEKSVPATLLFALLQRAFCKYHSSIIFAFTLGIGIVVATNKQNFFFSSTSCCF